MQQEILAAVGGMLQAVNAGTGDQPATDALIIEITLSEDRTWSD